MNESIQVFDVLPGDPLIVDEQPQPNPFEGCSMQYTPVSEMKPRDIARLAAHLMALTKGELLIIHDPDTSPTAFDLEIADLSSNLCLADERYVESDEEGGNLAAAIVRELEFIAEEHRKLAERTRKAFEDYVPYGWK